MFDLFSHRNESRVLLIAVLILLTLARTASAQTTSFTYQGRLTDGGTPANGNYDLQLALWDSLSSGNQIGSTQTLSTVAVNAGIFTVTLDFGANAFPGANRFLEISARLSGGGSFTLLTPRQQITSTPYAVRSLGANAADTATTATNATQLGGVAAANYVQTNDSRLTDARPPTAGSSDYIQNTNSPQASSNFNISGNGAAAGTLSGNVVNATTQYNIGSDRVLTTAGTNNIFAGPGAGAVNTGTDNAFFGFNAGNANTTAGRNSFFGSLAGSSNNTGAENSFFGYAAGTANTTGIRNSAFGGFAGNANTIGNDNAFFGYIAGRFNTTGGANAFFGTSAGANNTTGATNSFFGRSAGEKNNTGSDNSFFGALAGFANTTGLRNSVFGSFAAGNFLVTLTASDNSFFGYGTGFNNTSGAANSFFGSFAGNANTVAPDNSFFGFKAGSVSTGSANSFFGSGAGFVNSTGSTNSFFGRSAGNGNNTGSNNSFFGFGAGTSNTTEDKNTFVGANANGAASITNATAIGANASVAQSNSLVLGSIAGVNGASASVNVGIGTSSPTTTLDVKGEDAIGNTTVRIQSSLRTAILSLDSTIGGQNQVWNLENGVFGTPGLFAVFDRTAFAPRLTIDTSGQVSIPGNVGIGTTSPTARLDVRGVIIGNSALVQIGAPTANADSKIIGFGDSSFACGGPCVSIGEADADNRMVLRASTFRVRGGNWNPDFDNAYQLGQPSNRWSEVWAVNGAIQTSDARLKQRIANLRYGLNQVMQLRPVTFQWKDGSDRRTHLGLIAQEVEPVMPEIAERGADERAPLGMNYNNLIPVLVNAIKQQQQQISALRQDKAALDVRLAALEKRTERRAHTRHRRTGSTSAQHRPQLHPQHLRQAPRSLQVRSGQQGPSKPAHPLSHHHCPI